MDLRSVSIIQGAHGLQFYNNFPITYKISLISLLKFYPIVDYLQLLLTLIWNVTLFEFYLQGFLINGLQESMPQSIVHLKCSSINRKTHISVKQHIAMIIFFFGKGFLQMTI